MINPSNTAPPSLFAFNCFPLKLFRLFYFQSLSHAIFCTLFTYEILK